MEVKIKQAWHFTETICGRDFILIEKEPKYVEICKKRLQQEVLF